MHACQQVCTEAGRDEFPAVILVRQVICAGKRWFAIRPTHASLEQERGRADRALACRCESVEPAAHRWRTARMGVRRWGHGAAVFGHLAQLSPAPSCLSGASVRLCGHVLAIECGRMRLRTRADYLATRTQHQPCRIWAAKSGNQVGTKREDGRSPCRNVRTPDPRSDPGTSGHDAKLPSVLAAMSEANRRKEQHTRSCCTRNVRFSSLGIETFCSPSHTTACSKCSPA